MDPAVHLLVQKDSSGYLTENSVKALSNKRAQLRKIIFKWEREGRFGITPPLNEFEQVRSQIMDIDFLLVDAEQTEDTAECERWDSKLAFIYNNINSKLVSSVQQNGNHQVNPPVNHSSLPVHPAPTTGPSTSQPVLGSHASSAFSPLVIPDFEMPDCQYMEPGNKLQVEFNCDSNGNQPQPSFSKVNAYAPSDEDDVTPCLNMPDFLQFDRLSGKYVFHIGLFDFETPIAKKKLQDESVVNAFAWAQFNKTTSDIISDFYKVLAIYYKHGLSPKFRRNFCAAIAFNLPLMEKKYTQIRELSAHGSLSPDLSDTVKAITSYSDLLFSRLEKHSRYQLKKLAKKEGFQLKVKKRNGYSVAENNRKRKRKKKAKE